MNGTGTRTGDEESDLGVEGRHWHSIEVEPSPSGAKDRHRFVASNVEVYQNQDERLLGVHGGAVASQG